MTTSCKKSSCTSQFLVLSLATRVQYCSSIIASTLLDSRQMIPYHFL